MILVVFFFNEFIPCIHGKVFDSGNLLPVYIREGDWEGEILSRIYTEWALNVLKKVVDGVEEGESGEKSEEDQKETFSIPF